MAKKKTVDVEVKDVYAGDMDDSVEVPDFDPFFDGDDIYSEAGLNLDDFRNDY